MRHIAGTLAAARTCSCQSNRTKEKWAWDVWDELEAEEPKCERSRDGVDVGKASLRRIAFAYVGGYCSHGEFEKE